MSNATNKKSIIQNYKFLAIMVGAMVAGCILGWLKPEWGPSAPCSST